MKTKLIRNVIGALVACTLGLGGTVLAQGNGGGGGGDTPEPPDFGDLVILHRDELTGYPILDENFCQQPRAFPENVGCELVCAEEPCLIPIDTATCTIPFEYATCANEADFGRTNVARADESVLDFHLEDVMVNLAIADCTTLDPAGRMVHSRYVDDELKTATLDSPLANLSVYKHLVRDGTIGVTLPEGVDAKTMAARGIGVAMDKAGEVNMDMLAYINAFLGLTEGATIFGDAPYCMDVKEEVMGTVQMVEKCFLDYSSFVYVRESNFSTLPSPAYIPADEPLVGFFEFLEQYDENRFWITTGPIMSTVFGTDVGDTRNGMAGFVQAADDTRAVINYMHSHPVWDEVATPIPCIPQPNPTLKYDLSISDQSGLKVPKQVVSTTEGREFVVTVANAGPDVAAGTIVLTAERDDGGVVLVGGLEGPFEFAFEGLLPGMSYTTGAVFFTLSAPHEGTKIVWTAEAVPESVDPNLANNVVVKTSNVRSSTSSGH